MKTIDKALGTIGCSDDRDAPEYHIPPHIAKLFRYDDLWKALDATTIISMTDLTGKITFVNYQFCKVSGYTQEELIGKAHSIIRHPETPKELFAELWTTLQSDRIWRGVLKNRRKDGSSYYVRSTIFPMHDAHGRVIEYLAIRDDITAMVEQMNMIREQSTDALTGLPNREKLAHDLATVTEPKLAVLNIDRFRDINESYGHAVGDEVLVRVAERLRLFQSDVMTLYRIYGDEFALLADSTVSEEHFIDSCQTIIAMLMYGQIEIGEISVPLSVRIGAAVSQERLVMKAEHAARQAKDQRKSFLFYHKSFDFSDQIQERMAWTKRIVSTLEDDRFVVYAQPIVNVADPAEKKYECLIRMKDGEEIVGPMAFLDHAKRAKLYEKLTIQVIRKALNVFSRIPGDFSINLTMEDIVNPTVMGYLEERLAQTGLASRLIIEIVESENITDFEEVRTFIRRMHAGGTRIAIDDFGSGYSNFDYLLKLNVDFIKIDGSLIRGIDTDTNARLLVRTITEFAKNAGIKTIAEFVHSEAIARTCIEMGIDYLQGFYLGEPASLAAMAGGDTGES